MALWLHHSLADSDPAARPALALAHAIYRLRPDRADHELLSSLPPR